jgi:hypothetical protein
LIALHIWPPTLCRLSLSTNSSTVLHTGACSGSGNHGERLLLRWNVLYRNHTVLIICSCGLQLQSTALQLFWSPCLAGAASSDIADGATAGTNREPHRDRKLWSCCR